MRGSGIAQERLSSRARITPASRRESTVMASLTARSGRWVVASATRSSPVVRSISTRGLAVRSAKNSVWPLKRTPASLMICLCTGAVTIASNSPASAQASQPELRRLVRLARADRFHGLAAPELVGVIEAAVPEHLHQVPAELRVKGLAELVVLESRDRLLELRRKGARARPAEVAPVGGGSRVLGGGLRKPGELLTLQDPLAQRQELAAHGRIVGELVGLHEDVAHVDLILHGLVEIGRAHV